MKYDYEPINLPCGRRSREGAWIEILVPCRGLKKALVAPARERGLKYACNALPIDENARRSREGAWIEIAPSMSDNGVGAGSLPRGSVD